MKLYLAPGACSLADHIALHEAGLEFDRIRVDLRTKRTADGGDFTAVNPKGYVPALVLDDGQLLTENVAILCWAAERAPQLAPGGAMGRIRLIEMLAFIATELHKPFVRAFFPTSDAEKQAMLRWGRTQKLDLPEPLPAFFDRVEARPAVRLALQHEGLA